MGVDSKQGISWGVLFVTLTPATICFALRMQSRRLTRVRLWWDDYMAIAGYSCSIAWLVLVPIWIHYGLGIHIQDVSGYDVDQLLFANKLILWIAEFFYAFSLYFAKTSILCFYWRIFGVSARMKLAIKILLVCALIWIIIRTFLGIFHCIPIQAYWDPSAGGYCAIEDTKFFFGSILVHVMMDIAIIVLPVMPIKHLTLPMRQRVAIAVVFMFGFFICFAGIMIIYESTKFDTTSIDLTWNIEPIVTWATVEVNMVVVSASLPTIRPALLWLIGRRSSSAAPNSDSGGRKYAGGHHSHSNRQWETLSNSKSRSQIRRAGFTKFSSTADGGGVGPNTHSTKHAAGLDSSKLAGGTNGAGRNGGRSPIGDGDSEFQLVDSPRGNSSGEYELGALDGTDFRTVINANGGDAAKRVGSTDQLRNAARGGRLGRRGSEAIPGHGIVVQSETSVHVEERR
ncbi:uncharacterized protein B0I36DRAFT_362464 [Microdochium trichocladiopsis]|uniref:Rhodopsin domain-containing protein n=1 Tax=Microdochium trichocladiopsis TaxID=1682393 RepID=A0A9P9BQA1_9PEZI|nr:uncharacterized protein B0I36DRAFT_362464 [Microdochium trichocladiopsis]KAH7030633.1 hypothetical protein B0I36DRAFT_362464 [Microdochium trichocladiopsis]